MKQAKTMKMDLHHAEAEGEALERWLLACLTLRLKPVVAIAKTTKTTWTPSCLEASSKTATLMKAKVAATLMKAKVSLIPARLTSRVAATGAVASLLWQCAEHQPRSHGGRSANHTQNDGCAS